MTRKFEILRTTHLGPIKRDINTGDIVWWDRESKTLMVNGDVLKEEKGMDFERAIETLEKQLLKDPDHPLVRELSPMDVSLGKVRERQRHLE
jgi:hypothetical protein